MDSFDATVPMSMEDTEAALRPALANHGFGVLTEIDLAGTLRAKLGVEREPIKILGACNPHFANAALDIEPAVALLLPCNVVLSAAGEGTNISIVDPRTMVPDPEFAELTADAAARLEAALGEVTAAG